MKNKLYTKAQIGFKIPISVSGGTALFQPAGNIPMITWPDGSWCFPANVYMLDLLKHGRSRAGGGGTLLTYASNISHLIRFCASNGIDLTEITDSYFTLFVKSLAPRNKNDASSCLPRNMNTVINIARNSLDLLATAGKLRGIINFVSEDGIIRATKKETKSKRFRGSRISMSWYHHSFPNPDTSKKRLPVTDGAHHALMEAAAQTKNIFIRKRRFIMLHLLECTGCRRSELVRIEVNDVLALQGKQRPLLKVFTAKKRFNEVNYRFIPISPPDVVILLDYVTKNRAPVIGRTVGHDNDHGMLLISQLTGQPIYANTITQELRALALNTSLGEPISPHMYRHRFITMLFIHLIRQHSFENEDAFRRAVLSTETIKQQVQQWTGHASIESLEPYIHIAFADTIGFTETVDRTIQNKDLHSFHGILLQIANEIDHGLSKDETKAIIMQLADSIESL